MTDSISEEHFFSLSCLLYDHVTALPVLPEFAASPADRVQPQHLYLRADSPLMASLEFPPGFELDTTPLVGFRR